MSEKKDLVVKMTINSADFENGLKNAKASMNKFESSTFSARKTIQSFVGGAIKGFTALGVAVVGKDMFNSFIHSTQDMGDKWDNTMAACKTSWQSFQSEIILNGGAAVTRLGEMYNEAKKLAELMDQYGSSQISQNYANMRYETIISNAITQYRDAKKNGDKTQMDAAYKTASEALNDYVNETNKSIEVAMAAAIQHARTIGVSDINQQNFWNKFDDLYLRINRGELSANARTFQQYAAMSDRQFRSDVWSQSHPTYMTGKYSVDMPDNPIARANYAMRQAGYSQSQIAAAESEFRQSQIVDEKLQSQFDLLKNYGDLNQRLNSWKRRVIQMVETTTGGGSGGSSGSAVSKTSGLTSGLTIEQLTEYYTRQMERVPMPLMPYQEYDIPTEDIIEPETDMIVESVTKKMAELVKQTQDAFVAANALGGAFSALGNLAGDNMFGNIASGMGSIISQAVATAQAMMTLAGANTIAGITDVFKNTPGLTFTKIALTATALAGVLSVISTAKNAFAGSFADGGIVGGNSYSGDRLWARVNSGEMILNRSQQASLMNGGNVKFVIEGSQLKGVLDNYESIQNM